MGEEGRVDRVSAT